MQQRVRLRSSWIWIVAFLWGFPALAGAQALNINLGKPTPDSSNQIAVSLGAQLLPLAPTTASCQPLPPTSACPAGISGPCAVFTASSDHSATGQGGQQLVSSYQLSLYAPTGTTGAAACYTARVFAVNSSGISDPSPVSDPFLLALAKPAAVQSKPGISKQ
jgi:hypothetical protein